MLISFSLPLSLEPFHSIILTAFSLSYSDIPIFTPHFGPVESPSPEHMMFISAIFYNNVKIWMEHSLNYNGKIFLTGFILLSEYCGVYKPVTSLVHIRNNFIML